ncbi:MAG: hypothetical protein ABIK98_04815, partial [Pseudomonadota bacterium]
ITSFGSVKIFEKPGHVLIDSWVYGFFVHAPSMAQPGSKSKIIVGVVLGCQFNYVVSLIPI